MKRLILLTFILCCVVQAQTTEWFNYLGTYYSSDFKNMITTTLSSGPGEYVALASSIRISPDSIVGDCEYIYFKGITSTAMQFKKRYYFAFIPKSSAAYNIVEPMSRETSLYSRTYIGNALCIYGKNINLNDLLDIDYEVPFNNPVVSMRNFYSVKVKYEYNAIDNTVGLYVPDAKPIQ